MQAFRCSELTGRVWANRNGLYLPLADFELAAAGILTLMIEDPIDRERLTEQKIEPLSQPLVVRSPLIQAAKTYLRTQSPLRVQN